MACMPRCRVEEWRFAAQYAFIELFFGGSVEGCHILLAEAGEFSYSYLADLYGPGGRWGGGVLVSFRYKISCTQALFLPPAHHNLNSYRLVSVPMFQSWKVGQWLQARNSPLCGTLFRS